LRAPATRRAASPERRPRRPGGIRASDSSAPGAPGGRARSTPRTRPRPPHAPARSDRWSPPHHSPVPLSPIVLVPTPTRGRNGRLGHPRLIRPPSGGHASQDSTSKGMSTMAKKKKKSKDHRSEGDDGAPASSADDQAGPPPK